jgi:tRNA(fMet)-specific endonuclease VapC
MDYLLDTNIGFYLIKQKPTQVIRKFETLAIGSVALSSITLAELNYGLMKSANPVKN